MDSAKLKDEKYVVKKRSLKPVLFVKRNIGGWLIMLVPLILFAFYIWYPLFRNVQLSFFSTKGFKIVDFIGFQNYKDVFSDSVFIKALINTFKYAGFSIVIGFIVPIVLALLLNEMVYFKGFMRIVLYFPSIMSGIAVGIMWKFLFDPSPGAALNSMFAAIGLGPFRFLSSSKAVIPLIVLTMTWRGAGATVLIYLSSLQTVDSQQYEAARMDGAGAFARLKNVTVPHLLPMIGLMFILQIISVFQIFYEPLVMTNSAESSMTLLLLSYDYAFGSSFNIGKSSATSIILSLVIMTLTLVYLFLSRLGKKSKKGDI